jgi:hypothetical protein
MDLSPKKIEHIVKSEIMSSIEKMDRKTLNELYYLAVKQLEQTTKDYNKLLDEFTRNKQMDANDSEHIFTPRTYNRGASKPEGIIKESTRGQRTDRPDTTPSFNRDRMTWRFLGEDSHYVERPPTPPRKTTPRKTTTRKGGKRGKYNKTMRK